MEKTLEIDLPRATAEALQERAEMADTSPSSYVRYLIEEDLNSHMNARILFAPVREGVHATEGEIEVLVENAREGFVENDQD